MKYHWQAWLLFGGILGFCGGFTGLILLGPVVNNMLFGYGGINYQISNIAWSAEGDRVAFRYQDNIMGTPDSTESQLYVIHLPNGEVERVGEGFQIGSLNPAPNRRWIAYTRYLDGQTDLYFYDWEKETRLTDDNRPENLWVWSPDSRYLAAVSSLTQPITQYRVSILDTQTATLQEIFTNQGRIAEVSWSPMSEQFIFTYQSEDSQTDLYLVGMDNLQARPLARVEGNKQQLVWSPNGEKFAYVNAFTRPRDNPSFSEWVYEIYEVKPVTLENRLRLGELGYLNSLRWQPDNANLLFFSSGWQALSPEGELAAGSPLPYPTSSDVISPNGKWQISSHCTSQPSYFTLNYYACRGLEITISGDTLLRFDERAFTLRPPTRRALDANKWEILVMLALGHCFWSRTDLALATAEE